MININGISPYIRAVGKNNILNAPLHIRPRIICDYELVYVENGSFTLNWRDQKYPCHPGDFILIRPNITHSFEQDPEISYFEQSYIHFDMTYNRYSEDMSSPVFKLRENFSPDELKKIRPDFFEGTDFDVASPILKVIDRDRMYELFSKAADLFQDSPPMWEFKTKEVMLQILCMIFEDNLRLQNTVPAGRQANMHFVREYINNNWGKPLSLEELSMQFHYNKYYLEKKFCEEFGMPIMKYYNDLRFDKAKFMLENNWTVTAVAEALSFKTLGTFSRFFKTRAGISPAGYAEKVQKKNKKNG